MAEARIHTFPIRSAAISARPVATPSGETAFSSRWESLVTFAMLAGMLGVQAGIALAVLGLIRVGH